MCGFTGFDIVFTGSDGHEQIQRVPLAHRGRPVLPLSQQNLPPAQPDGQCRTYGQHGLVFITYSYISLALVRAGRLPPVHPRVHARRR